MGSVRRCDQHGMPCGCAACVIYGSHVLPPPHHPGDGSREVRGAESLLRQSVGLAVPDAEWNVHVGQCLQWGWQRDLWLLRLCPNRLTATANPSTASSTGNEDKAGSLAICNRTLRRHYRWVC